jgi:hypothetical protein
LNPPASRPNNAESSIAADMEKETAVAQTISPHKGKTGFERQLAAAGAAGRSLGPGFPAASPCSKPVIFRSLAVRRVRR